MLVKRIDAHVFDVFWGNGWYNWARFDLGLGGLTQVKGVSVPHTVREKIAQRFNVK